MLRALALVMLALCLPLRAMAADLPAGIGPPGKIPEAPGVLAPEVQTERLELKFRTEGEGQLAADIKEYLTPGNRLLQRIRYRRAGSWIERDAREYIDFLFTSVRSRQHIRGSPVDGELDFTLTSFQQNKSSLRYFGEIDFFNQNQKIHTSKLDFGLIGGNCTPSRNISADVTIPDDEWPAISHIQIRIYRARFVVCGYKPP